MNVQMQRPEDKPKSADLRLGRLEASLTWPWNQGWGIKREGWHFFHIRLGFFLVMVSYQGLRAKRRRLAKRPSVIDP